MDIDQALRSLAESQHALVARWQARSLGLTKDGMHYRLRRGEWKFVNSRVMRLAGSRRTDGQSAMAAVLACGPGAMLSHTSAAAWWGIARFELAPFHVTRPRHRSRHHVPAAGTRTHHVVAVDPSHVKVLDGVPLSSPARVVFELAGSLHPLQAERALDNAWSMKLVDWRGLHRILDELSARGRKGTTVLRELMAARPVDYVPPASNLERRFESILADAGERPMLRQVNVGGGDWVGRVDFRDPDLPLVVEVNSERYHAALSDRRADATRYAKLRAAGFVVLVFTDDQVWRHPREVLAEVVSARRHLRGRRRAA